MSTSRMLSTGVVIAHDLQGEGVVEIDPVCLLLGAGQLGNRGAGELGDVAVQPAAQGIPGQGRVVHAGDAVVTRAHDLGKDRVPRVVVHGPFRPGHVRFPAGPGIGLGRRKGGPG